MLLLLMLLLLCCIPKQNILSPHLCCRAFSPCRLTSRCAAQLVKLSCTRRFLVCLPVHLGALGRRRPGRKYAHCDRDSYLAASWFDSCLRVHQPCFCFSSLTACVLLADLAMGYPDVPAALHVWGEEEAASVNANTLRCVVLCACGMNGADTLKLYIHTCMHTGTVYLWPSRPFQLP